MKQYIDLKKVSKKKTDYSNFKFHLLLKDTNYLLCL